MAHIVEYLMFSFTSFSRYLFFFVNKMLLISLICNWKLLNFVQAICGCLSGIFMGTIDYYELLCNLRVLKFYKYHLLKMLSVTWFTCFTKRTQTSKITSEQNRVHNKLFHLCLFLEKFYFQNWSQVLEVLGQHWNTNTGLTECP